MLSGCRSAQWASTLQLELPHRDLGVCSFRRRIDPLSRMPMMLLPADSVTTEQHDQRFRAHPHP